MIDPSRAVASFDSATALHAAVAAALRGQNFPHLGQGNLKGAAVRAAGLLPWPILRQVYTRVGAAEAVQADRLGEVDMGSVAHWLTSQLPQRQFPGVMIGSSNGALAHLAAAMQVPYLPGTLLVPVQRVGDPHRPVDALRFGEQAAPRFLERNPDVMLHQMHDQVQDELMIARMAYFRAKWRSLPAAYASFLTDTLAPGAPVILVEDESQWPVVSVGERHVFQSGAQGGLLPDDYLQRPHTPRPDTTAPEAEWGADPQFGASVAAWCAAHDHPLVRITFPSPQAISGPVANTFRDWFAGRGEDTERLVVPSFVVGDPWKMINTASVPYWTFFAVQPALDGLNDFLEQSPPFTDVDVMLFQHGVMSAGIARPDAWDKVIRAHGARPHFPGLVRSKFPHDIGYLGRYGRALSTLPSAEKPWQPLPPQRGMQSLEQQPGRQKIHQC